MCSRYANGESDREKNRRVAASTPLANATNTPGPCEAPRPCDPVSRGGAGGDVDRSQSDAEIGAIVRAALNQYLAPSVVTHAGVTQRLELECVESAEVKAVCGPGQVVIDFSAKWVQT